MDNGLFYPGGGRQYNSFAAYSTFKTTWFIVCILGLLLLPSLRGLAQRTQDRTKKVDFKVMVETRPESVNGAYACVPLTDAQIHLSLSDGRRLFVDFSVEDLFIFKGLPADCEYMAEVFSEGYSTAIYHGKVPDHQGFPGEFFILKNTSASAKRLSPFKDAGVADVEGFVVCPPESWQWVSEPLPEACVLYVSAADSVCTKTDAHGYFRFDGIKDKTGKVSVSRENYKSVEAAVPPEDGSRWLWLRAERDQ